MIVQSVASLFPLRHTLPKKSLSPSLSSFFFSFSALLISVTTTTNLAESLSKLSRLTAVYPLSLLIAIIHPRDPSSILLTTRLGTRLLVVIAELDYPTTDILTLAHVAPFFSLLALLFHGPPFALPPSLPLSLSLPHFSLRLDNPPRGWSNQCFPHVLAWFCDRSCPAWPADNLYDINFNALRPGCALERGRPR